MTDKTGSRFNAIELVKYPTIVLSIVIGLLALELGGIKISKINLREGSVEVERQEEISLETSKLASSVQDLESQILDLQAKLNLSTNDIQSTEQRYFSSTQDVTDAVAQLSKAAGSESGTLLKGKSGWIWIGNTSSTDKITLTISKITDEKQNPVTSLSSIEENDVFRVDGNMVLRAKKPKNDVAYFRGVPQLGVIPKRTRVKAMSLPEPIDREYAVQWWLNIEVSE